MILVDSSAWIEFDHATGSTVDHALTAAIAAGGSDLATTEPVLMEVLAGARTERQRTDLRRLLTSFAWVPLEAAVDFEGAERLYRRCRAAGITPRGLIDCMIAAVALRAGAELLAADGDFSRMAEPTGLRLHAATPSM